MRAGQKLRAIDGYQVALFHLEYLYISQGELMPSNYSHYNTYNMDFLGWGASGRIYDCPLYAPVDLKVVALWDYSGSHTVTFESINKVHLADGTLDYLTIEFTHAENPPFHTIGDVVLQGSLVYYTGTFGQSVTGDHVHICTGRGHYDGYTQRDGGHYDLTNRIHLYDALYINDTIIEHDEHDYPWQTYIEPTPTPTRRKGAFPWVLYAKKLREKMSS